MKKLFIKTYGCQMNFYDSDHMSNLLNDYGYETSEDIQKSDKEAISANNSTGVSFLKIDALKKGSHALSLLLKTNDIIVGVDKKIFRGTRTKILPSVYPIFYFTKEK